MRFIVLICCCLFSVMSRAQTDSTREFEATKGSWRIPIDHASRVSYPNKHFDDMFLGCFPGGVIFYSKVKSVIYSLTPGRVETVLCIGNAQQSIFINYGKYCVVYNGLLVSTVSKGDLVAEGKIIGYTLFDTNGENELEVALFFKENLVDYMEEWYGAEFWKLPRN